MYWVSALATASVPADVPVKINNDNTHENADSSANTLAVTSQPESDSTKSSMSDSNSLFSSTASHTLAPSQKVVPPKMPDTSDQLIQVTLALALVVGLIYGVAWLFKRTKGMASSTGIPMRTLSVLPMGVKEKIVLVEVGGKQILLGMTPHQINTLATFDEPIVDASLNNDKPFSSRLKEILSNNQQEKKQEQGSDE